MSSMSSAGTSKNPSTEEDRAQPWMPAVDGLMAASLVVLLATGMTAPQVHAWAGVAFAVLAVVHGIPSVKGKRTRMAARGGGAPKKAPHAADSHDILPGLVPDKRPLPHRRTVRRPRRQHGLRLLDGRAPCGRLLSGGLHRAPYAPQLGPPAPVSGSRQPLAGAGGVPIGARPQPMTDLCAFIAILTERALCQLVKQIALRPKGDQ